MSAILVDTSVWIDHFRKDSIALRDLLLAGSVVTHAMVLGELACGTFKRRVETLAMLKLLGRAVAAADDEVHALIESERLFGRGLGWTDVSLLASARLSSARLWTRDRTLRTAANALGVGHAGP